MQCDHCGAQVHPDDYGWYVGADQTSDCPKNLTGHEIDGHARV